ncbi:Putative cyclic-AMP phosphodiesterase, class-II, ribonuclease Z/Hydroxyacylglutathione hydrolase [Septoria linicola]|uniref:Cyclic-AMP phosphodiesterase, class-II, ribonuclease Z/Hydroxyacylglutathione hydrolase n=1 Tax=Septoria linicola TaxID=215465 RepID=A0A9Q9AYR6_9PEZI|nr:putative cyclic-AMP phosphodiesterase, class-II, ribonuclease Z/Hydroxyacylglutathione hydrolase [Septoria linicola]USW53111.1 Putative cyclic-AMP phosphodiesterase, class-II, ribonuclease Z/Hydroxyacylglutathione hydrolase [Septoria linicola]
MRNAGDEAVGINIGLHGQRPALQVICLGNSGGPSEENVTAFLVRSIASDWAKRSLLAVDAGSHLAPITRILERDFPSISRGRTSNSSHASTGLRQSDGRRISGSPIDIDVLPRPEPTVLKTGPFAGLKFPNESARANALHVLRTYVSTYLITHPHLDHLSGFAINTAAFNGTSRPKTLAALPSTVNAIKQHVFNDVIWPNLTDEDGGVGFVTFQRLKEGGDLMMGEGEGRGYIDVCDGLAARAFKVSHGVCTKSPPSHVHRGSIAGISDSAPPYNGSIQGIPQDQAAMNRSLSISAMHSQPGTPGSTQRQSFHTHHPSPQLRAADHEACVVDSTAYFLRDEDTQREVIIFGDVEPDSLSLTPRNFIVWQEAARKIAQGVLGGIFIECSYDDSQADAILFGHLNPKHLIAELQTLASLVIDARAMRAGDKAGTKRKRSAQSHGPNGLDPFARLSIPDSARKRSRSLANRTILDDRRRSSLPDHEFSAENASTLPTMPSPASVSADALNHYHFQTRDTTPVDRTVMDTIASPRAVTFPRSVDSNIGISATAGSNELHTNNDPPLSGIKVIIIHVKDTFKDGPHVSENILAQLQDYEDALREKGSELGCEFVISQSGESYWF